MWSSWKGCHYYCFNLNNGHEVISWCCNSWSSSVLSSSAFTILHPCAQSVCWGSLTSLTKKAIISRGGTLISAVAPPHIVAPFSPHVWKSRMNTVWTQCHFQLSDNWVKPAKWFKLNYNSYKKYFQQTWYCLLCCGFYNSCQIWLIS